MKSLYLGSLQIHSNTSELGYVVFQPIIGLEFPGEVRLQAYNKPGEHGSIVSNQLYGGRPIIIEGRISGASIPTYEANRRSLENALRIIKDSASVSQPVLLKFQTMDNLLLQCNVYAQKAPAIVTKSLNHASFHLELYAPDPNLYDQSNQTATITAPAGGGVVYPVIYPVTFSAETGGSAILNNAGDADTYPTLTFNGPLTSPFVTNTTTGETFLINGTLISGDVLICDMQNKTMTLNGITNALNMFTLSNVWLKLFPGNNTFTFGTAMSSDTGNCQIGFRSAYIGV